MLCVLLGLDRAGKSSIKVYLETLNADLASKTEMSNGIEVYQRGSLKIEIFPGQRRLRYNERLYQVFFPMAQKILFVFDAADRARFGEVEKYFRYVEQMIEKYCREEPELIFVAHKQDLEGAIDAREFFDSIIRKTKISKVQFLNTSIYDPWSMADLLKAVHGTDRVGTDSIVDTLRRLCSAEFAFIYDGHILPLAYSPRLNDSVLLVNINDVVCSLEKLGQIEAFVGFFRDKNFAIVSVTDDDNERVLVGVLGFSKSLRETLALCRETGSKYLRLYRGRLWT